MESKGAYYESFKCDKQIQCGDGILLSFPLSEASIVSYKCNEEGLLHKYQSKAVEDSIDIKLNQDKCTQIGVENILAANKHFIETNQDIVGRAMKIAMSETHKGNLNCLRQFFFCFPLIKWYQLCYAKTGDTILHVAASLGYIDIARFLLQMCDFEKRYVNYQSASMKTPLHEAAQCSKYEMCLFLLECGANVNALKNSDWSPLMLVCAKEANSSSSLKIVELFLEYAANVNFPNKDGWTALHLISRTGDLEIFELLIRNGADYNLRSKNGRSVLHIAALHGHFNIVEKLLDLGCEIDISDYSGNQPLHEAVMGSHLDVCTLLYRRGADMKARNRIGYTILHLAASLGHSEVLEELLKTYSFDVNVSTPTGVTPLHCAARKKVLHTYEKLLIHNADETRRDEHNRLPKDYLCI